ncbi:MAG: hypothetical protein J6B04_01605 [Clostridia bacterium]|nr:hypothetical protein [Clostridia bacterium]
MTSNKDYLDKTFECALQSLNVVNGLTINADPLEHCIKCDYKLQGGQNANVVLSVQVAANVYQVKYDFPVPKLSEKDMKYILKRINEPLKSNFKFKVANGVLHLCILEHYPNTSVKPTKIRREVSTNVYQTKIFGEAVLSFFKGEISYGEYVKKVTFR